MIQRDRTDVSYEHGLQVAHYDAAAELYEEAFGRKFSRAIAGRDGGLSIIRNGLRGGFAFSAAIGNSLVGLAGITRLGALLLAA